MAETALGLAAAVFLCGAFGFSGDRTFPRRREPPLFNFLKTQRLPPKQIKPPHRQSGHAWLAMVGCAFALFCMFAAAANGAAICGFPEMGSVEIVRGRKVKKKFSIALAATPEVRRRGLMHCRELDPETGMLFVYPDSRPRAFWMKNTPVELAIIFISADRRIVAIAHGVPYSQARIVSSEAVQYVLEINYGERNGLAVGDRVFIEVK